MNRPIRTTLVLAFIGGFIIFPALNWGLTVLLGWPAAIKLTLGRRSHCMPVFWRGGAGPIRSISYFH